MLRIIEGEPWIMWPDSMVVNFIDFPASRIFDYNEDFEFHLIFDIDRPIEKKSALFAKLPTYFGIDLEKDGITLIYTDVDKKSRYEYSIFTWDIGRYDLFIRMIKGSNVLQVYINGNMIFQEVLEKDLGGDDNSHIIFGAGNFPKNGFNLNYLSVIFSLLEIKKGDKILAYHEFDKFINDRAYDSTNNCNFIHKL